MILKARFKIMMRTAALKSAEVASMSPASEKRKPLVANFKEAVRKVHVRKEDSDVCKITAAR